LKTLTWADNYSEALKLKFSKKYESQKDKIKALVNEKQKLLDKRLPERKPKDPFYVEKQHE
jgi:hypothetical protein